MLFVAVTAEEKGLLGSRYFATHPTVPAKAIVANINMDMFLPLFPMKSVMVFGLDESDLGASVRQVAAAMGLGVQGDPEPVRNRFIRSDQYSFIRHGVPALALKVGYEPDSPEAETHAAWTKERYHAPSDDLQQPVDREAAVGFNDLLVRLTDGRRQSAAAAALERHELLQAVRGARSSGSGPPRVARPSLGSCHKVIILPYIDSAVELEYQPATWPSLEAVDERLRYDAAGHRLSVQPDRIRARQRLLVHQRRRLAVPGQYLGCRVRAGGLAQHWYRERPSTTCRASTRSRPARRRPGHDHAFEDRRMVVHAGGGVAATAPARCMLDEGDVLEVFTSPASQVPSTPT